MTTNEYIEDVAEAQARRRYQEEQTANEAVDTLTTAVNRGTTSTDAVADAIAREHPTLAGQVAKAVGIGIMRRTMRSDTWRAHDRTTSGPDSLPRRCQQNRSVTFGSGVQWVLPEHPEHDGRLDCATVIGAELMARQSYI